MPNELIQCTTIVCSTEPPLQAIATSSSSVLVIWSPDGESTNDSYQLRYQGRYQSTDWTKARTIGEQEIRVTGLFPGDQYTFEVTVIRNNQNDSYVTATAVTYPLPPTDLTVSATTTSSLKIQWRYDSSTSFCMKWKIKYTDRGNGISEIITNSTNVTDLIIDNLYPGMTYTVDVSSVTTDDVASETAQVEATVKPTTSHNLTVDARTVDLLLITWDAPSPCVVTGYIVNLEGVPGSERIINANENRTTFTDLAAGTQYTVVVVVVSGYQRSQQLEGQFYTRPNVPQNLVVNSQTVATLTLSWDTPVSGLVTEYKIRLLDVSWTEQTISGRATRKVIFTGLTAGAEYVVVLVAVSGDQQSETVEGHFYTEPNVATNMTSLATANTMTVTWDAPSFGFVEKYTVEMTSATGTTVATTVENSTNTTFTGLTAGTQYNVVVVAVSGDQHSKALQESFYTKPNMAENLMVDLRTLSSLIVTWDAPKSTIVEAYAVSIRGLPETEHTMSGRANRKATFDGLTAGTRYTVSVLSVSGDMTSDNLEEQFYTNETCAHETSGCAHCRMRETVYSVKNASSPENGIFDLHPVKRLW
ncbi:Fibronectin [Lamellibrachia satsuma]|nr:Fibronectin [Lamellibrachia satsuma]